MFSCDENDTPGKSYEKEERSSVFYARTNIPKESSVGCQGRYNKLPIKTLTMNTNLQSNEK
jgi:hypothetical protein